MRFIRALLGLVLTILLLGAMTTTSLAATYCVRPTQQGNGDGLTWTNAKALSSVISSGTSRGHTYYISGEGYGAVAFSALASGTSLITMKKATASDHVTDTGWNTSWGTTTASFDSWYISSDYWYLDGQVGGGPGSWNTDYGFSIYSKSTDLITLYQSRSHITIRHTKGDSDRTGKLNGIKATTGAYNNIVVSYCQLSNMFGVPFHINSWSDCIIEYCYLYANKSTPDWHGEGISSIGTNTNITIRYSLWDMIEGTAVIAGVNSGRSDNWQIYGNIFSRCVTPVYYYWEAPPSTNQNEMINLKFINNTIVGMPGVSEGGVVIQSGSNNLIYNNIWYNNIANSFGLGGTHDYNYASNNVRVENCSPNPCDKNSDIAGTEAHGQKTTRNPFLNYNSNPLLADFTAYIQAGLNTNSLVSGNGVDMLGRTRGADGTWDRGAIEFLGKNPLSPTNVQIK